MRKLTGYRIVHYTRFVETHQLPRPVPVSRELIEELRAMVVELDHDYPDTQAACFAVLDDGTRVALTDHEQVSKK